MSEVDEKTEDRDEEFIHRVVYSVVLGKWGLSGRG